MGDNSYYTATVAYNDKRSALDGDVEADICIIGGGLAGITTALDLAERCRSVVLLEQASVGSGASGRAGGFVLQGFDRWERSLIKRFGEWRAQSLFELSRIGHELVRSRIEHYEINCGPLVSGALMCALNDLPFESLENYRSMMAKVFGVELEIWPTARVRDHLKTKRYSAALFNPATFSVHPLNLVCGLAGAFEKLGGRIFEDLAAIEFRADNTRLIVRTGCGSVRANHVVLTCGGYIGALCKPLFSTAIRVASHIIVTEPLGDLVWRVIGVPFAISDLQYLPNYYRRLSDGRLLWGGRASTYEPSRAQISRMLKHDLESFYPDFADAKVDYAWSGWMSYLAHEMPSLGQLAPNIWYATGFGGLGLATTSMAGRLIGSAIAGDDDRWRQFNDFGLPYTGGPLLARLGVQFLIWSEVASGKLGRRRRIL